MIEFELLEFDRLIASKKIKSVDNYTARDLHEPDYSKQRVKILIEILEQAESHLYVKSMGIEQLRNLFKRLWTSSSSMVEFDRLLQLIIMEPKVSENTEFTVSYNRISGKVKVKSLYKEKLTFHGSN